VRWASLGIPVAYLVHDVLVRGDRRRFLRLLARDVDLAIAVSDAVATPLRSAAIETVVVRNGTEWPVEAAAPDPRSPRIVGCSALLTPWKGQDVLLEAWARLQRDDAVLELIGGTLSSDEDYAARLRERAVRPDLEGRVRIVGHVADSLARMRTWTVAVSASVDPEAAPLNVLEGMSLGLPFVATAHGGTVEVLGEAGILVPPRDANAMAEAIASLLDDPVLHAGCAAAGRAQIERGLTLDHHLDHLLGVLASLADSRPASSRDGRTAR
jgi:glycosyltransferase involved in cell wall biosynthesis